MIVSQQSYYSMGFSDRTELSAEQIKGVQTGNFPYSGALSMQRDALDLRSRAGSERQVNGSDGVFRRAAIRSGVPRCSESEVRSGRGAHSFGHLPGALFADGAERIQRFLLHAETTDLRFV